MADQKRWFKVWTSILSDPSFSVLPPDDVGRWVRLGAAIALNGDNGNITGTAEYFSHILSCSNDIESAVNRLPNVHIKMHEHCNGKFIVTMLNWNKYQKDSTGYERQKKFRQDISVTVQDKIRDGFTTFWNSYPKKKSKGQAERAWSHINPDEQIYNRIIKSLEQAKKSVDWRKDCGKYIPYPATWLNAKGWEDEYESRKTDWQYTDSMDVGIVNGGEG